MPQRPDSRSDNSLRASQGSALTLCLARLIGDDSVHPKLQIKKLQIKGRAAMSTLHSSPRIATFILADRNDPFIYAGNK
jgi:hypothetical protein